YSSADIITATSRFARRMRLGSRCAASRSAARRCLASVAETERILSILDKIDKLDKRCSLQLGRVTGSGFGTHSARLCRRISLPQYPQTLKRKKFVHFLNVL